MYTGPLLTKEQKDELLSRLMMRTNNSAVVSMRTVESVIDSMMK